MTGTGSLAAAESVVEYRPGAEAEARYVAAKLHINQKQPADPDAIAQAGPAQVIVVLGADQASGAVIPGARKSAIHRLPHLAGTAHHAKRPHRIGQ